MVENFNPLMVDQDSKYLNKVFIRQLLTDFNVFSEMLKKDMFETDITRIGAEQELAIVSQRSLKPKAIAPEVLEEMKHFPWLTPEIAAFNLECNMSPRKLTDTCFSEMESETLEMIAEIRKVLEPKNADLVLCGILPTLRKYDLDLKNLTKKPRYEAIIKAINAQQMGDSNFYELRLSGIDEILVKHDSPLLEACNTSFQVHLQTTPDEFVKLYNISQAVTPILMSIAANSPIVFGKRLWHETRIALFQQALDTRRTHEHMRIRRPRVQFGGDWLQDSILEIFKEDISRFRILMPEDVGENSKEVLESGKIPRLKALLMHNSTVYRWNRPCYGISKDPETGAEKPHLRIENRVIPAGPTVIDQISNAAFWIGCVKGLALKYDDITTCFDSFADISDNFVRAARYGLDCELNWMDEKKVPAKSLVLDLLEIAREGLESVGIAKTDIDRYLGTIEKRVKNHCTGARWQLRAYTKLLKECKEDEALTCLTASIMENQRSEIPVHDWPSPSVYESFNYLTSEMKVEDIMSTDLFTIQKDDIIDFVIEMMDWREERYLTVEDKNGNFEGLVTSWSIFRHLKYKKENEFISVEQVMYRDPTTILPSDSLVHAIEVMEREKVPCLPVITKDGELVGMLTETNFVHLTRRFIKQSENDHK